MAFFNNVFTDEHTGRYSSHKVWYTVANAVATYVILRLSYYDKLTVDFFVSYMGIVGGYSIASKYLSKDAPTSMKRRENDLGTKRRKTDTLEED